MLPSPAGILPLASAICAVLAALNRQWFLASTLGLVFPLGLIAAARLSRGAKGGSNGKAGPGRAQPAASEERQFRFERDALRVCKEGQQTWISAQDVARILGLRLSSDKVRKLSIRFGHEGFAARQSCLGPSFSPAALDRYLSGFGDLRTARFRRWLDRALSADSAEAPSPPARDERELVHR